MLCFVTVFGVARDPKIKTVTAEYDYPLSSKDTPEEGKLKAIEQAQFKAIANEFGSAMTKTSHFIINTLNEKSTTRFDNYVYSDVNGEWIETISEEANLISDKGMLVYHVKVKGKIRELVNNKIDIDWAILSNGTDPKRDKLKNDTFLAGDYMYIYFMSPVAGYLAVYLADCGDNQTVQCLIPYKGSAEGAMKIEPNRPYIFFSLEDIDNSLRTKVGRIKVNAHDQVDYNQLYLVFSPNEFVKVVDKESDDADHIVYDSQGRKINLLPRQTESGRFQHWLGSSRIKDPDMQVVHTFFKIEK